METPRGTKGHYPEARPLNWRAMFQPPKQYKLFQETYMTTLTKQTSTFPGSRLHIPLLPGLTTPGTLENIQIRDRSSGLAPNILALNAPGSNMDTGSKPDNPAFHPSLCLWSGKAVEDGPKSWDPAPMWETQKGSWHLPSVWLSTSRCIHLASESWVVRSSSLSLLLSVYLTLQ